MNVDPKLLSLLFEEEQLRVRPQLYALRVNREHASHPVTSRGEGTTMTLLKHCIRGMGFVAALVIGAVNAQTTHAAIVNELGGNLFHQYNQAVDPNVGIAINNPQNMGGGAWVGTGPAYPVGGQSNVLDGDLSTNWDAGTFSGGGMANIGISKGYYQNPGGGSFTFAPFPSMGTIRIWAAEFKNENGTWWIHLPTQVKVAYATTSFDPGNGFSYNSAAVGALPAPWVNDGNIFKVNGVPVTAPLDPAYANGWADITNAWTGSVQIGNYPYGGGPPRFAQYVDLSVDIPAGATSIMISFGQENASTNNPGGLDIRDVQAIVPEPASASLLAIAAITMTRRRGRA
jgi:hypothetical protein